MDKLFHEYHYKRSKLFAVPAAHIHSAFAVCVHNICRNPETKPNAIAVELGHSTVMEIVKFLKELKQGGMDKEILPCMLGIMKKNRYIHSDWYDKARQLQELYQMPLNKLPTDVLNRALNFSHWSTIFLAPNDSIIEAIRCAMELNIPVYGVDLDDFANTRIEKFLFEDPQLAHSNYLGYSNRVMEYCHYGKDPVIDLNREVNMSAGLKECMRRHKKVLFTCGMAHWRSIVTLLNDSKIPAKPVFENCEKTELRRTIVHPSIAASAMEILPQVTFNYEMYRYPVSFNHPDSLKKDFVGNLVRHALDSAYKTYSAESIKGKNAEDNNGWTELEEFEKFLFKYTAVAQKKIPTMSTMMRAAETMMNDKFCRILAKQIMDVEPDWASSADFPGLPTLLPSIKQNGRANGKCKLKLIPAVGGNSSENSDNDNSFFFDGTANQDITPDLIYRYFGIDEKHLKNSNGRTTGLAWIWPPCEALIHGIAFKAVEQSNFTKQKIRTPQAFEGSIEGGINMKATMRSIINGENKIYVSTFTSRLEQAIIDGISPDPIVFIFEDLSQVSGNWAVMSGGDFYPFITDHEMYNENVSKFGNCATASIYFENYITPPQHLSKFVGSANIIQAGVTFGNPCINAEQTARWLEDNKYKCCPLLPYRDMDMLAKYYSKNFGVELNPHNHEETFLLMAIPFAKKSVTIIAHDSFQIPASIRFEAAKRKVGIDIIPLRHFSLEQIQEARLRISFYTFDEAGKEYPPEIEFLMGQKKEAYFDLLPKEMRRQLKYFERCDNEVSQ
ncbi:MAG: hypothetical protein V1720_18940 [bacterium]